MEFQGRATFGFNAVGGANDDVNGHGTHLAGIASSSTYGVARFANIIAVKVLNDQGSSASMSFIPNSFLSALSQATRERILTVYPVSTIISGIQWAVKDMQTRGLTGKWTALLAVGGSYSAAMNSAVASATSAGLFFAVPTGSDGGTGNTSPASEPSACTVGGTTSSDARMSSANYGSYGTFWVPILAPLR